MTPRSSLRPLNASLGQPPRRHAKGNNAAFWRYQIVSLMARNRRSHRRFSSTRERERLCRPRGRPGRETRGERVGEVRRVDSAQTQHGSGSGDEQRRARQLPARALERQLGAARLHDQPTGSTLAGSATAFVNNSAAPTPPAAPSAAKTGIGNSRTLVPPRAAPARRVPADRRASASTAKRSVLARPHQATCAYFLLALPYAPRLFAEETPA